MKWYYYLHTNGDLIGKNPVAYNDADFLESDFVKCFWLINTNERLDAWLLCIEALARGARVDRVKELATKWDLNKEDLKKFLVNFNSIKEKPTEEQKTGLDIFLDKILNIKPDDFWEELLSQKVKELKNANN